MEIHKPFLDRNLAFFVFEKRAETLRGKADFSELMSISALHDELKKVNVDSSSLYLKYWNAYNQPIDLVENSKNKINALCEMLTRQESEIGEAIVMSPQVKRLLLQKDFAVFFKDEWYLDPVIVFSDLFYKEIFNDNGRELLFKHYEYEADSVGENSDYHLPVSILLRDDDPNVIQPHEIDKAKAKLLLDNLQLSGINRANEILRDEVDRFTIMLRGVINDGMIVIVYNYTLP